MKRNGKYPALLLCIGLLFLTACGTEPTPVPERSDTEYIFVHGLSGWGSYDKTYKRMPYWGNFFSNRKQAEKNGRSEEDYAAFDMHIDNALAMNARIATLPQVYYFAVPCSATEPADGVQRPIRSRMEPMFRRSSAQMGAYTGMSAGGFVIDETWQENDGLVNTVSAMAPVGEPSTIFAPDAAVPGIWQILPTYSGDHMSLQGGMMKRNNIRPFYLELLELIDQLLVN